MDKRPSIYPSIHPVKTITTCKSLDDNRLQMMLRLGHGVILCNTPLGHQNGDGQRCVHDGLIAQREIPTTILDGVPKLPGHCPVLQVPVR